MIRFLLACAPGFPPHWYDCLPRDNRDNGIIINGIGDIIQVITNVIQILLSVAGVVAVIMIIVGAIRYIGSQGEPDNLKQAKDTIVNAVIGLIFITMIFAIINFIGGAFG